MTWGNSDKPISVSITFWFLLLICQAKQSQAEPSQAKQSKTKQSQAKPSQAKQTQAKQSKAMNPWTHEPVNPWINCTFCFHFVFVSFSVLAVRTQSWKAWSIIIVMILTLFVKAKQNKTKQCHEPMNPWAHEPMNFTCIICSVAISSSSLLL